MSVSIRVCRGNSFSNVCSEEDPSLSWGDDISDPLLTTEEAAKERGRVEIETNSTNRKIYTLELFNSSYVKPTSISAVIEKGRKVGMVRSFELNISRQEDGVEIASQVNVETE